ncbi:hypothetical protein ACFOUP_16770 [Belliella kenyensis]|uniref:Uncharacterized protein n=1 Tax=Belliella kenyensis TaxID=1472724 RepID=A0ABV8EPQ8_9BACT|nr:hypothetical protein [Belliella kenyensis]MCH7402898.1 hypothetical protein [Belliella kenyensis]MDN3602604.1 hypothetical protein [Belliella kenyensis]
MNRNTIKIKFLKSKVKKLVSELKTRVLEHKMGVMFDFEERAKDDIKFLNTIKNLVKEYAKLKGMQFKDFIEQTQNNIGKELGQKNSDYLKRLWDEIIIETIFQEKKDELNLKLDDERIKKEIKEETEKLSVPKYLTELLNTNLNYFEGDDLLESSNSIKSKPSGSVKKRSFDSKNELKDRKKIRLIFLTSGILLTSFFLNDPELDVIFKFLLCSTFIWIGLKPSAKIQQGHRFFFFCLAVFFNPFVLLKISNETLRLTEVIISFFLIYLSFNYLEYWKLIFKSKFKALKVFVLFIIVSFLVVLVGVRFQEINRMHSRSKMKTNDMTKSDIDKIRETLLNK